MQRQVKSKSKKQPVKPTRKATVRAQARHVAPQKEGSGKAATPPPPIKEGSKSAKIIELLNRPGGSTLKALMEATGWQAHSVRGFLSGTVRKKLGLTVQSEKTESGERSYSIAT